MCSSMKCMVSPSELETWKRLFGTSGKGWPLSKVHPARQKRRPPDGPSFAHRSPRPNSCLTMSHTINKTTPSGVDFHWPALRNLRAARQDQKPESVLCPEVPGVGLTRRITRWHDGSTSPFRLERRQHVAIQLEPNQLRGVCERPATMVARTSGNAADVRRVRRRQNQQRRRQTVRGRTNLLRIVTSLLRLGILPFARVAHATDVARLALLANALRRQKVPEATLIGLLIVDWAARAPELTASFMDLLQRRGPRMREFPPVDLVTLYAEAARRALWTTFWQGRAKIHARGFLRTSHATVMLAIASRLCVRRPRSVAVLGYVQTLTHMGPYMGLCLLRAVTAAAGKRLRACRGSAVGMSAHTALLATLLPFVDARKALRRETGDQPYDDNLIAFFYCETMKVLRHEGILQPLRYYAARPARFAEDMASNSAKRLADWIETMETVGLQDNGETDLLNEICPEARQLRHSSTNVLERWRQARAAAVSPAPPHTA